MNETEYRKNLGKNQPKILYIIRYIKQTPIYSNNDSRFFFLLFFYFFIHIAVLYYFFRDAFAYFSSILLHTLQLTVLSELQALHICTSAVYRRKKNTVYVWLSISMYTFLTSLKLNEKIKKNFYMYVICALCIYIWEEKKRTEYAIFVILMIAQTSNNIIHRIDIIRWNSKIFQKKRIQQLVLYMFLFFTPSLSFSMFFLFHVRWSMPFW